MQDLHADLAAFGMHRLGDEAMLGGLFFGGELGRADVADAFFVGRDTSGHDQPDTAAGALGKIGRHALEATWALFEASVHRAHQGTVAQGGEAQVERGQQVRITVGSHGTVPHVA